MKIVYLIGENLSAHPGLQNKIDRQIASWLEAGHEVYRVLHFSGKVVTPDGNEIEIEPSLSAALELGGRVRKIMRLSQQYSFAASVLKRIKPDITYSRYLFPAWSFRKIAKYAGKIIFEINSDDKSEYWIKHPATGAYNQIWRRSVLGAASGLVFVTRELANSKAFSGLTPFRTVIANGVECSDYPFVRTVENAQPQLGFIGSPGQAWHGVDKLATLCALLPDCTVHVIGPTKRECIAYWGSLPSNLVVHGYLSSAESKRVISLMDVGISTLALHRKGMNEACPLKVRQYLAQGLPVLAASHDTDISSHQAFYLRLPNCEDNIRPCSKRIIDFVQMSFRNSHIRTRAREFAMSHMAVGGKEAKRLLFFKSVLGLS